MTTLETPRLRLRPIGEDDAAFLFRLHADTAVARVMPRAIHASLEQSRALLQRILAQTESGTSIGWIITLLAGDAIGTAGLVRIDRPARRSALAYELLRAHWGTGLAREAVNAVLAFASSLDLTRIEAEIDSENTRSFGFIEKLGFVRQKSYEETIDGTRRTTLLYQRSRDAPV